MNSTGADPACGLCRLPRVTSSPQRFAPNGKAPGTELIPGARATSSQSPASIGSPGGGGIGTAADVALFYQGVIASLDPGKRGLWDAASVVDACTRVASDCCAK